MTEGAMWTNAKPIDTAPRSDEQDKPFLLWCPEQGGWHTGVWSAGRWVDSLTLSDPLEPTHWLETPPDPYFPETPAGDRSARDARAF
jgi:hypothetical protein